MIAGFDAAAALDDLKDFQRRTVDHVFRRMYLDQRPTHRFLIADEVGLGKTMVARGIIARAIEHLAPDVERIDIVYICSNASIARQNINRLNVLGEQKITFASRLTMLPTQLHELEGNRVNFVSFTPSTTFDLRSRGGIMDERALLLRMLLKGGVGRRIPLMNALQCNASRENFLRCVRDRAVRINQTLAERFHAGLKQQPALNARVEEMCDRFARRRKHIRAEDSQFRYAVIGDLRRLLAHICVDALEPDLVILDEFQRFKDLLTPESEAGELAQTLMTHVTPEEEAVRVLLLSATPYRSYTMQHEEDDDHYRDFLQTARFLYKEDQDEVDRLDDALRHYRSALLTIEDEGGIDELDTAQRSVEEQLLLVMSRTERVAHTEQLDAMLSSHLVASPLAPEDLGQAQLVDGVAQAVGAQDPVEYWKSAPYLLQFMKDYQMKSKLVDAGAHPHPGLAALFRAHQPRRIRKKAVDRYEPIGSENGRMRGFIDEVVNSGSWKLLWVPPSMPYLQPAGGYAEASRFTKALVFSSWTVVPDAIAALVSYEVERRMLGDAGDRPAYSELTRRRRGLLRFSLDSHGQPRAMNTLASLFPSPALAGLVDPLEMATERGEPIPPDQARSMAVDAIRTRLEVLGHWPAAQQEGAPDPRWYWAAVMLLERGDPDVLNWCRKRWQKALAGSDEELGDGLAEHIQQFGDALEGADYTLLTLGRPPDDLFEVLADLALGSPAVCAFRSLRRLCPEAPLKPVMSAAVRIAEGFRSLFNVPETMGLLRAQEDEAYWHLVAKHGIDGNLQAVLDEYAHVLREWLGLQGHSDREVVHGVADAMAEALSLRTARVEADAVRVTRTDRIRFRRFSFRCRYALRFSELRDDDGKALARLDTVRKAFNSPFRPFVLASTSVGQEGLDFHPYCHRVYHWNLPRNPVDMEQREGRVHRYKGHAVRKNIARKLGLQGAAGAPANGADPWDRLFERASQDRPPGSNELFPYWLYPLEGGASIERRVPILPLSKEEGKLQRLKKSLALYRMVFGQPRQEDLLEHLRQKIDDPALIQEISRRQICLEPPR